MSGLKIGLIGAGQVGGYHLNAYQKIPNAHVCAVSDVDEKKAQDAANQFDIDHTYTDYRELLNDNEVEAVDICVHNNLHSPIAVDSLEAGKDVFCEKPMAGSYKDAQKMYEKTKETGKRLDIQNNKLYAKETRAAKKLIEDGKLGDLFYGRATNFKGAGVRRRSIPYIEGYGSPNFVKKEMSGGGALYDLATYTIGQIIYLLETPNVKRVSGKTYQNAKEMYEEGDNSIYRERMEETGYDVEDMGLGFVELEDDKVITITSSWHVYLDIGSNAIVGTKGGINLEPFRYYTTISDIEADISVDLEEYERRQYLLEDETELLRKSLPSDPLYHWVESLLGNENQIRTDEIALKTMQIMEGIYLSNELGREVTPKEIEEKSESTALR